jgi:hypothetical protein
VGGEHDAARDLPEQLEAILQTGLAPCNLARPRLDALLEYYAILGPVFDDEGGHARLRLLLDGLHAEHVEGEFGGDLLLDEAKPSNVVRLPVAM